MESQLRVRDETPADHEAITQVTIAAFETLEISRQTEHLIVEALRRAGALSLSLVAEDHGEVLGHVAFSPLRIGDGTPEWFGLGPVSVLPPRQRQGVGTALIQEGLRRLRASGAGGCCLVGYPDYYRRFGFRPVEGLVHPGVPPEVFLALAFRDPPPQGEVCFHEAFLVDASPE